MDYLTLFLAVIAWAVSGVATAPLVLKVLSVVDKQKIDRDTLLLFAIYGPVPALYLGLGYAINMVSAVAVLVVLTAVSVVRRVVSLIQK